jgi:hypothetical protein
MWRVFRAFAIPLAEVIPSALMLAMMPDSPSARLNVLNRLSA